ncbi:hypothetical protein Van01_01780 [Micromonospora andamanensis]|uniref:DUF5753 domain-containing protein n=1 Tax=Micromonospora andamanensis TaxID=1287068 RepID=A0ABQ4HMU7_9ACTN|nr:hypothetical protein Van01_01780 [Micromonospora andamanensis]
MNHYVDTITEHVEVGIGDQRGDFDQLVATEVQPGHLTVDPDEKISHRDSLRAAQLSWLHAVTVTDR